MAEFTPKKIVLGDINNGIEFTESDGVTPNAINDPIEAVAYSQTVVEHLTDTPDNSDIDGVGTPDVSFVSSTTNDNVTIYKFKFSNINGATFTPSLDMEGNLSWTNNKGLDNPPTINISGRDYLYSSYEGSGTYIPQPNDTISNIPISSFNREPVDDIDHCYLFYLYTPHNDYYWLACQVVDISTSTVTLKIINVVKLTGEQGATFTPSVDSEGNLSWTNDRNFPNPETVNIKGEKGDAATIEVGTVITGDAGTEVQVKNAGTTSEAVFNFTIPKGATGAQGVQGEKGDTGEEGLQYTTYISISEDPVTQGIQTLITDSFNRTPLQGEQFIGFIVNKLSKDLFLAHLRVSSADSIQTTCRVLSFIKLSVGPAGPQGEKGDTGEMGLACEDIFGASADPKRNDLYFINPSYFNREPLIGEIFTAFIVNNSSYDLFIALLYVENTTGTRITASVTSATKLSVGPQGPQGEKGAQGVGISSVALEEI